MGVNFLSVRAFAWSVTAQPQCVGNVLPQPPKTIRHWWLGSVFLDSRLGCYVMYLNVVPQGRWDADIFAIRLKSDRPDGWEPPLIPCDVPPRLQDLPNVVLVEATGRPLTGAGFVTPLADTPNAERGYVMTYGNHRHEGRVHFVAFSRDGLYFQIHRKHPWLNEHSDCRNDLFCETRSQTYRLYGRAGVGDRRAAVVITGDFETFSKPLVVLQPGADDLVRTEIYGLIVRQHGDLYVGFPLMHTTSPFEPYRLKMEGRVVPGLAYSYNGINWQRATRGPFLPQRPLGEMGGGGIYLTDLLQAPDGRVLRNAGATVGDHVGEIYLERAGQDTSGYAGSLSYELRQDGFVYLVTSGREDWLRTRTIIPRSGELTLNVRTAPHSQVRVQILHSGHRAGAIKDNIDDFVIPHTPASGYTYDDCLPIGGDHVATPVRWKEHLDPQRVHLPAYPHRDPGVRGRAVRHPLEFRRLLGRMRDRPSRMSVAMKGTSRVERRQPLHCRLGSKMFALGMHSVIGLNYIVDTQCGYKFFRRRVATDIFSRQRIDGYMFDVEILHLATQAGYRIARVPVRWRGDGDSCLDLVGGNLQNFADLLSIRFRPHRGACAAEGNIEGRV